MRALRTFSGDEPAFRGWLAVIARNHLADLAMQQLSTAQALRLLATLPPSVAEMIALRVVVGLDVPQVAVIVNRTPGAVRVAVHRGLRTLAAQLESQQPRTSL